MFALVKYCAEPRISIKQSALLDIKDSKSRNDTAISHPDISNKKVPDTQKKNADFYCTKCFEPNCKHWTVTSVVTKDVGFFVDTEIIDTTVVCDCGEKSNGKDSKFVIKCSCGASVIVGVGYLPKELKGVYKCPSSKCKTCNKTGQVLKDKYVKCTNCDGTGGTQCLLCYNRYKVHTCQGGYQNRCYVCRGHKSIVIGKTLVKCNDCISL